MIQVSSSLENLEGSFVEIDRLMNETGFILGGGYEYDHGYYDKPLDWEENKEHRAYLRVPVTAVEGSIGTRKATLRIGRPFVLKHQYQTKSDDHAGVGLVSGSFNQFAEPADKDDQVEQKWLERAQSELRQLEGQFQGKMQKR
ncbi:YugN family protein [Salinithrix halophila]|uniref:YugN family protein n=1 Tax=Salinithrix halophila TaxID=1485204 RepID=A0ABV8JFN7_9BACL